MANEAVNKKTGIIIIFIFIFTICLFGKLIPLMRINFHLKGEYFKQIYLVKKLNDVYKYGYKRDLKPMGLKSGYRRLSTCTISILAYANYLNRHNKFIKVIFPSQAQNQQNRLQHKIKIISPKSAVLPQDQNNSDFNNLEFEDMDIEFTNFANIDYVLAVLKTLQRFPADITGLSINPLRNKASIRLKLLKLKIKNKKQVAKLHDLFIISKNKGRKYGYRYEYRSLFSMPNNKKNINSEIAWGRIFSSSKKIIGTISPGGSNDIEMNNGKLKHMLNDVKFKGFPNGFNIFKNHRMKVDVLFVIPDLNYASETENMETALIRIGKNKYIVHSGEVVSGICILKIDPSGIAYSAGGKIKRVNILNFQGF